MENKSTWFIEFEREVMKTPISRREYRLFNIKRFVRSGNWVDYFSGSCSECREFKPKLMQNAGQLKQAISSELHHNIEFEQLNDIVYQHLRKDHKLIPGSYYISVYSLIGMLVGTAGLGLAGFLADMVTGNRDFQMAKNGMLFGWFFGLVTGRILGKRKDKIIKVQKRQF
ncbi:MAG: hypothetical protein JSV24_07630 [Bacteroidales bacterium]|nr:MAG: hypothetical protein JSV24_07630 [Bacteroidales bacterium]